LLWQYSNPEIICWNSFLASSSEIYVKLSKNIKTSITNFAFGNDIVKEFSTGNILHNNENVGDGINDLVESNDVWMIEHLQDVDFSPDLGAHVQ